jgi:hypothetical protein
MIRLWPNAATDPGARPILRHCSPGSAHPTSKPASRPCTCASGFQAYERLRGEVKRLQKDPSPRVRAIALHVEQDACRIEKIAAELETADTQGRSPRDQNWASGQRQRLATRYYLPL